MNTQEIGKIGEDYAEKFLNSQSCKILFRNYYTRFGEIDIIALSPERELIFAEVKARRTLSFGHPQQALNRHKIYRLRKTALVFLQNHPEIRFRSWRIDLLALKLGRQGRLLDLIHLKNVLDGS